MISRCIDRSCCFSADGRAAAVPAGGYWAVGADMFTRMLFAKLKHLLRKAARRTKDAIAQILDSVSAQECLNYFATAGYGHN